MKVMNSSAAEAGAISLPRQFDEPIREDLIIRSVLALQANRRQPYGGYGNAGMRHSSDISKRRRKYRGTYGRGQSRVPRKIHSRRGTQFFYVGATVAGTVGGRRAHGPKPFKDWSQKVNTQENRKAIRSALAATMNAELVGARGHRIPESFPFILDNDFESLDKTRTVEEALVKLGFAAELERASEKRIRAGKGTMRGRKYKRPVSALFVVSDDEAKLTLGASNIPGMEVVAVHRLNAELLAPGAHPGRLVLYTKAAIERLDREGLFTTGYKAPKESKKEESPAKSTKSRKPSSKKPAPVKTTAPRPKAEKIEVTV